MQKVREIKPAWSRFRSENARREASGALHGLRETIGALSLRAHELDSDTLALQLRLAQIPSPTGGEALRAAAVSQGLVDSCCTDVTTDNFGNVVARLFLDACDRSLAPVVCMAHLDTVFPLVTALDARYEGSRLTCPGIGDNGRGLAGIMTIARVLGSSDSTRHQRVLRRPIELVASVGEEGLGNLRGAQAYFSAREKNGLIPPHSVIVIDGPGDARIVHHALGSRRYRVEFRGSGGHSWADFGNPNCVHAAGRATGWLADLPRALSGKIALTVSSVGGGDSVNSIPSDAFIEIDLRSGDGQMLHRAEREIFRIVQESVYVESRSSPPECALTHSIVVIGDRPCGSLPSEHPLVALAEAATLAEGIEPMSAIASTDANIPLSLGIPAIAIGAGGVGGAAHTLNEWYENVNGPRGIARALSIIVALAA